MKFQELGLQPALLENIQAMNYSECTPIQEKAIPPILKGEDVFGLAQTGTGKTAAFLLPLIDSCLRNPGDHLYLIMEPTRELVDQVLENLEKLIQNLGIEATGLYGGTGYDKQKAALKKKPAFIVATPGRLIDLFKEGLVDFHKVKALVFDEADRMFDLGFKPDMKYILARVPRERQIVMLSATLNFDVLQTAYQFGSSPIEIDLSRDQAKAENVTDEIFHVGQEDKPKYLLSLIRKHKPKQAIVFTNFKNNIDRITNFLTDNGVLGIGISSLLNQGQRNRVIEQFKTSELPSVMVATDLAARGLDIQGVDLVINFELPLDCETYVHRIGRTGRAGNTGHAYSLVSDRDVDALQRIEVYLKNKLNIGWIEEKDLITEFKTFREERSSGERRPFQREGRTSSGPRPPRSGSSESHRRGDDGGGSRRAAGGEDAGRPRRDGPPGPRSSNQGPRPPRVARPPSSATSSPANSPASGPRPAAKVAGDARPPRRHTQGSGAATNRRPLDAGAGQAHASSGRPSSASSAGPRSGGSSRRHPSSTPRSPGSHRHASAGAGSGEHRSGRNGAATNSARSTSSGAGPNRNSPPPSVGQKIKSFWKNLFSKSDSKPS